MASTILGIAASHSPLLALSGEEWKHRAAADMANTRLNLSDGRFVNYQELLAEVGPRYEDVVTPEVLIEKSKRCQEALDRLADALEAARPDVVVIIGDDQAELFGPANQPTVALYHGRDVLTMDKLQDPATPAWMRTVRHGYLMDKVHSVPGHPEFALDLIAGMVDREIDLAVSDRVDDPLKAGFGHAYGFIVKRLFRGRSIPIVPIMLNTYFPPNVPTASRCHDMGRALAAAIESSKLDLKVAVIASGGLSHFVVDEQLDRDALEAIRSGDHAALRNIPRCALNSGSSEILNWVMAAGALEHIPVRSVEYYPLQRTPAGTGVGAGFVVWGAA